LKARGCTGVARVISNSDCTMASDMALATRDFNFQFSIPPDRERHRACDA
jgi:hypothetical protein